MLVSSHSSSVQPQHSRQFWLQLAFLCCVLGLCEAARGIVLPTLSLYVESLGGSSTFLSFVVAAFSVGRLSSSVVLGYVSDYCGMRAILGASVAVTCVGHILFISADGVGSGGLYLLLVSRVLTGFGTGTLSVCRSFVSKHTDSSERTRFMSWLGIVQFAGYAFTPILGGLEVDWTVSGSWVINTFTAGTYVLLLMDALLLVGLYFGLRGQEMEAEAEEEAARAMEVISPEVTAVECEAAWGATGKRVESDMREDAMGRFDEAASAVQTTGGQRRRGYSAVHDKQSDSDRDSDGQLHRKRTEHEEEKGDGVQPTVEVVVRHIGEVMEHKYMPVSIAVSDEHVSCPPEVPPIVVATARATESPTAHGPHIESVTTPTSAARKVSASQPPTPSPRSTSASAGLTASTLATLAAPSLPRDVFSSNSLDSSYIRPATPKQSAGAANSVTTATAFTWQQRLACTRIRLSTYLTPAFLIPVFFLLLNAASRGCLAVAETYGSTLYYTVVYGEQYDASTVNPLGAAWFYTALGAVGVLVFVLMDAFTHFLNELTLLCWGFIASATVYTSISTACIDALSAGDRRRASRG